MKTRSEPTFLGSEIPSNILSIVGVLPACRKRLTPSFLRRNKDQIDRILAKIDLGGVHIIIGKQEHVENVVSAAVLLHVEMSSRLPSIVDYAKLDRSVRESQRLRDKSALTSAVEPYVIRPPLVAIIGITTDSVDLFMDKFGHGFRVWWGDMLSFRCSMGRTTFLGMNIDEHAVFTKSVGAVTVLEVSDGKA